MKKLLLIALIPLLCSGLLIGQSTITGRVTNSAEEPLPGVNVTVKGSTQGTITDTEGKYTIENVPSDATLVFSFVGMLSEEIPVDNQSTINVSLVEDILGLDEVVVIGYGTVKKRDLTGSVFSVDQQDIEESPAHNALESIQGKVPGLDIVRSSGSAGAGFDLRIRGNRSIGDLETPGADQNSPLFIIDGVQTGGTFGISDLDPNNIQSIEVLKDASSTAIYGSQGANGVIIITTKRGKPGDIKVSYNGSYGINGFAEYPEMNMRDDYINLRKEAYRTTGQWDDEVNDINNREDLEILFRDPQLEAIDSNHWVDWHDMLIQNGTHQSHNFTVTGGSDKISSLLSLGYFQEEGMLINDDLNRYSARLNLDYTVNEWMKTGLQTKLSYNDENSRKDPLSHATSEGPLGEPYNEDGSINLYPFAGKESVISPLTDERPNISINNSKRTNILSTGYISLTPIENLSFRSNLSAVLNYRRQGRYDDETSLDRFDEGTSISRANNNNNRFITWNNVLTYDREFGIHAIKLTGITDYTHSVTENYYVEGSNQELASALFYNLAAASSERFIGSGYTESTMISYAARVNYSLLGRYLITLTERIDGASLLAEGNRWDHFPSVAAAWRISDEPFLTGNSTINNLKLRGSYGIAGNSGIREYGTQSGITPKLIGLGGEAVQSYQFNPLIGNDELGWEKSATWNIGVDAGLFSNRVDATIDLYKTTTTDIILTRQLPELSGVESVYQNIGSTENQGIEISLQTLNVNTSNFRWSSVLTYSKNNEKITGLISGDNIIQNINNSLIIGEPIQTFYLYEKLGIWQIGEEAAMEKYANNPEYTAEPGHIKLSDLNNDSLITAEDDRKVIGSAVPKWVAGFHNTFSYKNIELRVYLFARWGQMIEAEHLGRYDPSGGDNSNTPAYIDYWTPENPTNDFPRPNRTMQLNGYTGYETLRYVDGSFLKLKNIKLSYTLPRSVTNRLFMDKLSIYASATDLFTYSRSPLLFDFDPESGGSEGFPLTKKLVFGVNIEF